MARRRGHGEGSERYMDLLSILIRPRPDESTGFLQPVTRN